MKIVYLSDLKSIHAVRWVNVFAEHGHDVYAVSINIPKEQMHPSVKVHILPFKAPCGYYLNSLYLRSLLRKIHPQILNVHYASGYGTLARLSGFHPLVLSVWGSDVYDFPYESHFKMKIIQKNLDAADRICSTSEVMKRQTQTLLKNPKEISVIPFGIDTKKFTPKKNFSDKVKVIGTVKTLSPKYGISTLIKSFALLLDMISPDDDLKLIIVGDGVQRKELEQLAKDLNIGDRCEFLGKVSHTKVPEILHTFDLYAALSESESFGVAILEASACGLPVVVSDVGGLPEVVADGASGIVVQHNCPQEASEAFYKLYNDQKTRKDMGLFGVDIVNKVYKWEACYEKMLDVFQEIINHA